MTIANIIEELDAEIARLQQVRTLLSSGPTSGVRGSGNGIPRKKHSLSPEARERIAAAQRKRWAAQKRAAK
jgi:hypothetical protein